MICSKAFLWLLIIVGSTLASPTEEEYAIIRKPLRPFLLVGSVDGKVHAVDGVNGEKYWSTSVGRPLFSSYATNSADRTEVIIPSIEGLLYLYSQDGEPNLRPLSTTVKDLVNNSPFLAEDGTIFVGHKESRMFVIDVVSGEVLDCYTTSEAVCPRNSYDYDEPPLLLGRIDYTVRAYSSTGEERWNISVGEFVTSSIDKHGSHEKNPLPPSALSAFQNREKLWQNEIGAPSSFHYISYDHDRTIYDGFPIRTNSQDNLNSQVYISQVEGQLFAIANPSFQTNSMIYPHSHNQDGSSAITPSSNSNSQVSLFVVSKVNRDNCHPSSHQFPLCLLGFHDIANAWDDAALAPMVEDHVPKTLALTNIPPLRTLILGTAVISVSVGSAFLLLLRAKSGSKAGNKRKRRSKPRIKKKSSTTIRREEVTEADEHISTASNGKRVGNLCVSTSILGYGSSGTIVYEGEYAGRKVAVKRMLKTHYDTARKEISLLLETDEHPHVVQYFSKVDDREFIYLALSYCKMTLADCIEAKLLTLPEKRRVLSELTLGVLHLHNLSIVHRDLKPQNILLDERNRVKISDMGLAKKLENQDYFSTTGSLGTAGWQAPELLLSEQSQQKSEKVDIFALGCIYYYVLTDGCHPFGEVFERQRNILKNKFDVAALDDQICTSLILSMIDADSSKRPRASDASIHPFHWSLKKRLLFLKDASDRLEVEKAHATVVVAIESKAPAVCGSDWGGKLDSTLMENLGKFRKYNYATVRDLLRLIRNKSHHFRDLPEIAQRVLGDLPDGFLHYFLSRFPLLFISVYEVMKTYCKDEPAFKGYFELAEGDSCR